MLLKVGRSIEYRFLAKVSTRASPSPRSLPLLGSLPRLGSLGHEARFIAQVNDDEAVQFVILQLRPAPTRHLGHVGPIGAFPGPLDGRLSVPCARSPVHVPLDVAELEVDGSVVP